MWFAHWSRIPDRFRRYRGQGPALGRRRWEMLTKLEIRAQTRAGGFLFTGNLEYKTETKATTYS